jgi:NADH-quinone oxidoreductase subunit M
MNLLPFTIYLSFAGAALALVAGQRSAATARMVALLTAATPLASRLLPLS